MTTRFEIATDIAAPPQVCFDLARSVDAHLHSLQHTGERAIAGTTSGLLGLGDEVTWRGRHFGCVHEHVARITAFAPPHHFRDSMVRGRFRSFEHDHFFTAIDGGTCMRDVLEFAAPGGVFGRAIEAAVLRRYLQGLLARRAAALRELAVAEVTARAR